MQDLNTIDSIIDRIERRILSAEPAHQQARNEFDVLPINRTLILRYPHLLPLHKFVQDDVNRYQNIKYDTRWTWEIAGDFEDKQSGIDYIVDRIAMEITAFSLEQDCLWIQPAMHCIGINPNTCEPMVQFWATVTENRI